MYIDEDKIDWFKDIKDLRKEILSRSPLYTYNILNVKFIAKIFDCGLLDAKNAILATDGFISSIADHIQKQGIRIVGNAIIEDEIKSYTRSHRSDRVEFLAYLADISKEEAKERLDLYFNGDFKDAVNHVIFNPDNEFKPSIVLKEIPQIQYDGTNKDDIELFVGKPVVECEDKGTCYLEIPTGSGTIIAYKNYYIVKNYKGEIYVIPYEFHQPLYTYSLGPIG